MAPTDLAYLHLRLQYTVSPNHLFDLRQATGIYASNLVLICFSRPSTRHNLSHHIRLLAIKLVLAQQAILSESGWSFIDMCGSDDTVSLHGFSARNRDQIHQPYCRLSRTANSFPNLVIKLYNSIKMEIRSQPTKVFFAQMSRELKSRLIYSFREFCYNPTLVWTKCSTPFCKQFFMCFVNICLLVTR